MNWKARIQALLDAGATVNGIAERIGVTPNAVREVMAGRTKAPRADAAFLLAGLAPSDFAPGDPANSPEGERQEAA